MGLIKPQKCFHYLSYEDDGLILDNEKFLFIGTRNDNLLNEVVSIMQINNFDKFINMIKLPMFLTANGLTLRIMSITHINYNNGKISFIELDNAVYIGE